jgi:hypothetical protein
MAGREPIEEYTVIVREARSHRTCSQNGTSKSGVRQVETDCNPFLEGRTVKKRNITVDPREV